MRVQIRGIIAVTPISAAFSKNHSNRLAFFINEMAMVTSVAGSLFSVVVLIIFTCYIIHKYFMLRLKIILSLILKENSISKYGAS